MATKITKETYIDWFRLMLRLRKFEEKAGQLYGMQKIRGFCHLYIGQEAVAAGCISATQHSDPMITAYRDHGLAIAKGMSMNAAMAELYGKETGCSGGKGGSMHYFDKENHFFGGHGIVGAQVPLGAGIAFAEKYKGTDNVCLTFFGDGAMWQGAIHETFNLAALWKLPVIFICENNGYAMGTSVQRATRVHDFVEVAKGLEVASAIVDGMSCEHVHEAVAKAAAYCRAGKGPYFLEIRTYRYKGHSMSDPQKYRTKEEVEEYKALDPIEQVRKVLLEKKYLKAKEIEQIEDEVKAEVEACVDFAENSAFPPDSELLNHIYTDQNYPFLTD